MYFKNATFRVRPTDRPKPKQVKSKQLSCSRLGLGSVFPYTCEAHRVGFPTGGLAWTFTFSARTASESTPKRAT